MNALVRAAVAAALAGATWLAAGSAEAHATGLSRGEYAVNGAIVKARLTFARGELLGLFPAIDTNGDKTIDAAELAVAAGPTGVLREVPRKIAVRSSEGACKPGLASAKLEEEDGVSLDIQHDCPAPIATVTIGLDLLKDLAPGHRHVGVVSGLGAPRDFIAFAKEPSVTVTGAQGASTDAPKHRTETFGGFFHLGIEHILTGYDHLLFLFALLLVGGRWRQLLGVVTAFTVAHSITLGLAALNVFALSPRIVEPAIALSIVYVGVENFFVKTPDRRWLLTFPFGLVHGFGFAGALSEIALPRPQVPSALLAFNLGVESGQLAVVAVVLPLVLFLRKKTWFLDYGVKAASGLVVIAGVIWFVQRVFL